MKKFEKSEQFTKVADKLKKEAQAADLSAKKYDIIPNILQNNLPTDKSFQFTDAYVEKSKAKDGANLSHIRLKVDEEHTVSLSSLLTMGLKVGKPVSFKPSRKSSQLKGAGVLSGVESINPELPKFAGENGLNEIDLAAALVGQKVNAKETTVLTYYPQTGEEKTAIELNDLSEENRLALCNAKKVYKLTFE